MSFQCCFQLVQKFLHSQLSVDWSATSPAEGLTEEEIAAFKANTRHLSIKSFRPTSQSFTGISTFSPRPKVANGNLNGSTRPSQLDALSSSDSDSDIN